MKPSEQMTIIRVTPDMAKKFLSGMVKNRPLSDNRVVELALVMEEDGWSLNGETLKFDGEGRMIDGQHRCEASVLAGKAFTTYVANGVTDERAFATIDVGKGRTAGDIFAIAGIKDSNQASAIALLVYYHRKGMIKLSGIHVPRTAHYKKMVKDTRFSDVSVPRFLSKEALLEFAAPMVEQIGDSIRTVRNSGAAKFMSISQLGVAHFLFSEKDPNSADRFMNDFGAGIDLQPNDPVFVLREKMIAQLGGHAKITRWAQLFFLFKAWNKRRLGEKSKILKMVDGEEMPKII